MGTGWRGEEGWLDHEAWGTSDKDDCGVMWVMHVIGSVVFGRYRSYRRVCCIYAIVL